MMWFIVFKLGKFLACALPLKISYRLAEILSDIQYILSKKDRSIVINNLNALNVRLPQPTASYARYVFRGFGRYLVDFFRSSKLSRNDLIEMLEIEGLSHIDEALKKGKGVIIVSAHIGNWELGGLAMAARGYPISAVALDHKNSLVNNIFINIRKRWGMEVIPLGSAVKRSYKSLGSNKLLAILGDRDFSNNGMLMSFLGKDSLIPKGPAVLSIRTGAPIVPAFVLMKPHGKYIMRFENPLILENRDADTSESVRLLTQKCVNIMEDYIRKYPSQWLMFRRFWIND